MKFALVGGDERTARLASMLEQDGQRAACFALEKARLSAGVQKCSCLQSCVYGADCIILPAPAEKAGLLYAPLSDMVLPMAELIGSLWPGQLLCGGGFSDFSRAQAQRGKLRLEDVLRLPRYRAINGALTAEGALGLLISSCDRSLRRSRCLVCGWGRTGKLLALGLGALGAEVSIAARDPAHRSEAEALGLEALDYPMLEAVMGSFDIIVNTVPARVLTDGMLCLVPEETLLLELASAPGGFDSSLAENIGLQVIHGPGLPGRFSPHSAAELMKETVYELISGGEE